MRLSHNTSLTCDATPESRVSDAATRAAAADLPTEHILATCSGMIRNRVPNLLRLYLNPAVTQAALSTARLIERLLPATAPYGLFRTFLANSGDEALHGALKLARYTLNRRAGKSAEDASQDACSRILLVDADRAAIADGGRRLRRRWDHFDSTVLRQPDGEPGLVTWLPNVQRMSLSEFRDELTRGVPFIGTAVLPLERLSEIPEAEFVRLADSSRQRSGLLIVTLRADQCTDEALEAVGANSRAVPDIVVFDESFTNAGVPFGAFAAPQALLAAWQKRGMTTFHSTTYQPNTISTAHFVSCLRDRAPQFAKSLTPEWEAIERDSRRCERVFAELYSPSLRRMIRASGFRGQRVTAAGHFLHVNGRRVFDGVGGVACSLRGHNPPNWVDEVRPLADDPNTPHRVADRLAELTGLSHHVPAVSGSSAIESALRLALAAQFPRTDVVVLKNGFAGKTLLALTGTARPRYRRFLGPLYPHVHYLDPFAPDANERLTALCHRHPVAVIQAELVQGVGGVREIPLSLLEHARQLCLQHDCFLLADEIQTGMFRTGPFVRSAALNVRPDLLAIGKGTSDMVFPFAVTLFSDRVQTRLHARDCDIAASLQERFHYPLGYAALLNTLLRAETDGIAEAVADAEQRYRTALPDALSECPRVRDIRIHGLLIGIELTPPPRLPRALQNRSAYLYLRQMLQDPEFPLLMGFCQYEPSTLKFTPPLTVSPEEIHASAQTIARSLSVGTGRLLQHLLAAAFA